MAPQAGPREEHQLITASLDRPVLGAGLGTRDVVVRHVIPRLVEATVVPSAIFYLMWRFVGVWPALFAALGWTVLVMARRIIKTRSLPPLVAIVAAGLAARLVGAGITGGTFLYFLQPVVGTMLTGCVFVGSVVIGRPLVARLAADFCPLSDADAQRHGIRRLFRGLTVMWAAVLIANAITTLVLLLTLSADMFVALKSMTT